MSDTLLTTSGGDKIVLKQKFLDRLRDRMRGEVLARSDDGYEAARRIWNGQVTTRPGLIALCTGAADVLEAVRFAREHDLLGSVRGGGHAVNGSALCAGGLTIDLSPMSAVRIDPTRKTVRVQGGALWGAVDHEAQRLGLAVTGGVVSHTGVAGLTLGGGIGHLMRKYGLTIDSLLSCDVVTADCSYLLASDEENAELFWGLRGGGGNFGVVTAFQFQLHPVGPTVLAGMLVYPMTAGTEVLRFFRDYVDEAPDEVGILANLRLAPALPSLPVELHREPIVALVVCYAGDVEEGTKALEPVRNWRKPLLDTVGPTPYVTHQKLFDAASPHGLHYYWKSHRLPRLTDGLIDLIVKYARNVTSPLTTVPLFTLGGEVARRDPATTAYSGRESLHDINISAAWLPEDPKPERHIAWVRDFWKALEPHAAGVYVNFLSDESQDRVATAYGPETYRRLVALKDRYDPTNFFRLNQNVKPTA